MGGGYSLLACDLFELAAEIMECCFFEDMELGALTLGSLSRAIDIYLQV